MRVRRSNRRQVPHGQPRASRPAFVQLFEQSRSGFLLTCHVYLLSEQNTFNPLRIDNVADPVWTPENPAPWIVNPEFPVATRNGLISTMIEFTVIGGFPPGNAFLRFTFAETITSADVLIIPVNWMGFRCDCGQWVSPGIVQEYPPL